MSKFYRISDTDIRIRHIPNASSDFLSKGRKRFALPVIHYFFFILQVNIRCTILLCLKCGRILHIKEKALPLNGIIRLSAQLFLVNPLSCNLHPNAPELYYFYYFYSVYNTRRFYLSMEKMLKGHTKYM